MEKGKIVVVEDEGIVALQIKTSLEQRGYTVEAVFASGEETLANIEAAKPDLVLMDMKLQGDLDGIQTADLLRTRYELPIIFLTAHSGEDMIERAKKAEPYGYILKPFNAQELYIAVEVALHKHKIDREKEKLTKELREALEKVKLLSGLLPICIACKKIRDDKGYWTRIEEYIHDHSEAEFSHSLCSECAIKFYPEYFEAPVATQWEEKRLHGRRAVDGRWSAEVEHVGACAIQDISDRGVGLKAAGVIDVGGRHRVTIHSPHGVISHEAVGIWCRPSTAKDGIMQFAAGLSIVSSDTSAGRDL